MVRGTKMCAGTLFLAFALGAAAQQSASSGHEPDKPPYGLSDAHTELPDAPSASKAAQQGKLPNTPSLNDPFVPLSDREKFHRWIIHTYSPYTFSSVLMSAVWDQMTGALPTYGGGMEGLSKRFGATLANTEAAGLFKVFLLPTMLHQDPRYFAARNGGVISRAWYAATRVAVTRKDNGRDTLNSSELLGTLFVRSLANAYLPRTDRGFGVTMSGTLGAYLSDAGSNMLREFSPDIGRIFRKHEPEKVRKIEKRIPRRIQKITAEPRSE